MESEYNQHTGEIIEFIKTYFQNKSNKDISQNLKMQQQLWSLKYKHDRRFSKWFDENVEDMMYVKDKLISLLNDEIDVRGLSLLLYKYY